MIREEESRDALLCIKRYQPTTDETSPWQGLSFTRRVGSDELADLLKKAYPECETLRQRKHKAAIEFLTIELKEMQSKEVSQSSPLGVHEDYRFGSPSSDPNDLYEHILVGNMQQNTSPCTSPTTTHSIQSPILTDRSRLHTEQYTIPVPIQSPASDSMATAQTFVFSAKDGRPLQPKTKRKMTSEERVLYKKTRKRGACDKCKRMKGRCTHGDNAEVSDLKQGTKRRSTSMQVQDPSDFAKSRKTEESPAARQQSIDTHQIVFPDTGPHTNYNESTVPATEEDSSQRNVQLGTSGRRESQIDPMYVSTQQSHQGPLGNQTPGTQTLAWPFTGVVLDSLYAGAPSSSTTRSFPSFSPTTGYHELDSFPSDYIPWSYQGHPPEIQEPP